MTSTRPNINPVSTYKVMEVCSLLEIDRKTLKRHTEMGLVKCSVNKVQRTIYKGIDLMRYWSDLMT